MENIVGKIKAVAVLAMSAVTSALGALAVPFGLLVVCNVIDYATGVMAAPSRAQTRSSAAGLSGILKKVCTWLLVAVGMVVDALLAYLTGTLGWQIPFTFPVGTLVCLWLLANELMSILENISDFTGNIPPFLAPLIKWMKEKVEQRGKDER